MGEITKAEKNETGQLISWKSWRTGDSKTV